ncbi:plasmid IncI1-type surface exclusion protein ExcA [Pseudomonas fluorescens]|uniref:plasmid IncI1-type surface exclusion protein ExcA n=1 Tax=Pseudomonas fluorescens TaxID=294 RepID=UPI001BEA3DD1|nr:plasmid IncI1-type surface exclusion protein ExcA [Pseudomonas fluorescens]MBT2375540.1 plasmid IncI1-type surface exclusion protein ExcA [Pseudomonas fluorescens]
MVERLETGTERRFRFFEIVYVVGFPFLVAIGVATIIMSMSLSRGGGPGLWLFSAFVWALILVPVVKRIRGTSNRHRFLKSITNSLRDPEYFNPGESFEVYNRVEGKYLGIDTKNGTILYVHRIREGQVDVVGLTMDHWINREVEGVKLRLYTKLLELPRIEIATPWAQHWFDTLGAMEFKSYNTPQSFAQYVRDRLEALEREHNVQIPRMA